MLLFLGLNAPSPRLWGLQDVAPSEGWQVSGGVILDVEPLRMPPLVRGGQTHQRICPCSGAMEVDAGAPHRCVQVLLPDLPLHETDSKEVPPQVKVWIDPQEPLAQGDERRNVLNPIGGKVLKLHLVVVHQSPKELMGGHGESPLMEVGERNDVPFGQLWFLLFTGQPPLLGGGQRTKEASVDEAL